VALAVFAGLSFFSLFCRLFTDLAVPGWTSEVLIASFFGAVNALGISMLGEYVARIYDQVRGRPLYLIERAMNVDDDCERADSAVDAAYYQLWQDSVALVNLNRESTPADALIQPDR
jgi:dolichol-phosphate mannosyltransferase